MIICLNFFEGDNPTRGPIDHALPYPREFEIDYVHAYSKAFAGP